MADLEQPLDSPLEGETTPKDVINNDESTAIDTPSIEATTDEICEGNNVTNNDQKVEGETTTETPTEQTVEGETSHEVTTIEENTATEQVVATEGTPENIETVAEEGGNVIEEVATAGEGETIAANVRRSVFENHRLETYIWEPEETPRALLCICHGVHEHMGRYEKLINHLKSQGILVFGMDLVGHGNSEGVRGHIDEIQSYVTDVMGFTEDMKASYPNIPMFLMGHSMGGMIACMMIIQRETPLFTGLLLSSPGLLLGSVVGPIKKALVKLLASVAPKLGVLNVDPAVISSIPEEVEAYANDPLNIHSALKAGWSAAMMNAIEVYATRYNQITLPLYVMHGTGDQLVPIAASELVYSTASSTDKVYETFVDSFHEILHDIEQERARELISSWIIARLAETNQ